MANVSMKDQEYLDLIDQCRDLEEVSKSITAALRMEYEENDRWEVASICFTPQWPEYIQLLIRDTIAAQALEDEETMEYMARTGRHYLNTKNFTLDKLWGDECPADCVDLLGNEVFYKKYQEVLQTTLEQAE